MVVEIKENASNKGGLSRGFDGLLNLVLKVGKRERVEKYRQVIENSLGEQVELMRSYLQEREQTDDTLKSISRTTELIQSDSQIAFRRKVVSGSFLRYSNKSLDPQLTRVFVEAYLSALYLGSYIGSFPDNPTSIEKLSCRLGEETMSYFLRDFFKSQQENP